MRAHKNKGQVLGKLHQVTQKAKDGGAPTPKMIFLTLFGATEIKCPTLAEEFMDLREAVQTGALDINRWDYYMTELDRWRSSSFISFTLFGGFSELELPNEEEEVESLAAAPNKPSSTPGTVEHVALAVEALAERGASVLVAEARVKGYEGEACGECGNFTLVRNGTCLKCDTCGSTSGCS